MDHSKRMGSIEKDLAAFKHEIDQKTEKRFDQLENNLKSTDETVEKQYYEMLHKFDQMDKNLNDAVESMKLDVKQTI